MAKSVKKKWDAEEDPIEEIEITLGEIPRFVPRNHEEPYGNVEGRCFGKRLEESMQYGAYD